MTNFGIDVFIKEKKWKGRLENKRIAFLGHSASVNKNLENSLHLIRSHTPLQLSCVFSPQHGFMGTEQANMVTSKDANWEGLPLFSLYSEKNKRLTRKMLDHFDVLIVDLQDVGCRVYTYLTTLFYALEECSSAKKSIWILDRPNPAGRTIEGLMLNQKFHSFVGHAPLPMRHGLTLGELALWYRSIKNLPVEIEVIQMSDYHPEKKAWQDDWAWVLPSPNMTDIESVRCYSGTVLLEGTKVSEARGTVFPLKAFGFPNMKSHSILEQMQKTAPQWLKSCKLRAEHFQPTFDKFQNQVCSAIRIYATSPFYEAKMFRPFRLISLFLKCLKKVQPEFQWVQSPPYEYEYKKLPIDILSGDDFLRLWIEEESSKVQDLEQKLFTDEKEWERNRAPFFLYS